MTVYLRKATASQEVPLGQMLSSTDGLTAFTTEIAVTDIHIWKAGATTLAHSSAVATHISNGVFYTVLDATDTDTAGPLVIYTQPSGALPARLECIVLNAAVYDSWFSTGFLPVDLVDVHGAALTETTTQLAAGISKFFDVATPTSTMNLITAVTTCTTNADMRGTDNAALATELAKVPKSDSNVTWNSTALASINAEVDTALNTAIPGSPTADSINQRVAAIDILTEASGTGDLAAILIDTGTTLDALIKRILGMSQENFIISSPSFTDGNMTQCTVKIYPSHADADADTNVVATYTVTATYDGNGDLATYKSVKE